MAGLGAIGKEMISPGSAMNLISASGVPITRMDPPLARTAFLPTDKIPKNAKFWEGNPTDIVLSQYPRGLRELPEKSLWDDAASREVPYVDPASRVSDGWDDVLPDTVHEYQPHAGSDSVKAVIAEGMSSYAPGMREANGWARPGITVVPIAVGGKRSPEEVFRTLVHETRHALQYPALYGTDLRQIGNGYPSNLKGGWMDNARLDEEAVRFADARARYAQATGRLIDNPDEAERAAEMMFKNELGVGDGLHPMERKFYQEFRDESPAVRARQNYILQKLLMGAPVAAGLVTEE